MKEVKIAQQGLQQAQIERMAQLIVYAESIQESGREENPVAQYHQTMKLPRQQLYDEIWTISTSGVAKKYHIPYEKLKKACAVADIPLPSQSYWSSLSVGKHIEKTPLSSSAIVEVTLPYMMDKQEFAPPPNVLEEINAALSKGQEVSVPAVKKGSSYILVENQVNEYHRETLYQEVWAQPVTTVAKKYGVSDVAIHKVCKSMNIPVPPRGYWMKLNVGQSVTQTPLPPSNENTQKTGAKTFDDIAAAGVPPEVLAFLPDDERKRVFIAAQQIKVDGDGHKLHAKLVAHRAKMKAWSANHAVDPLATRNRDYYRRVPEDEPFLYGELADDTFPRIYCILDALFRYIEALGGSVNDDFSFQIRNERVGYTVTEAEDQVPHALTKPEQKTWDTYQKEKVKSKWVSEPKFRKWDYPFNGRLRFSVSTNQFFRDNTTHGLETRLGEILIALYEKSEAVRIDRESQAAAQRKRDEELQQRKLRRERYNDEVARTIALENEAADYAVACQIRAYIAAIEANPDLSEEVQRWIVWSKAKADWYDPTISSSDVYFGKRQHSEDGEQKRPKNAKLNYW